MKVIKLVFITACLLFFEKEAVSQSKMKLEDVIKISIENNQSIKSSTYNIEKEKAINLKSFNIPKPELFIEYEGVQGSLSNADSRKIGITQMIEFPSNYFLRSDVQESQIKVAEEELNSSVNSLRTNVKLNYYNLLLLNELLIISKDNYKIYEEFLFTAEKKYEAGESSNLEVLGARVNKIKFENEIKNLESKIKSSQSEIRTLMNVDYDITPVEEISYTEVRLNKTELLTKAINNNPELKMLNFQKEKSSNKISLSKGELLPDISFKYFRQKISGDNNFWGMEVGLGVPLWFWWEQSGNIKESNYEFKIASSEEISFRKSLENEINKTFEEYENSLRQMKFFNEQAMKEADEILRQSKKSYDEGVIGYVEYLNALNLTYDTKTQYLNSIYNYNQSIINMEKLTAGELK
ncbi:MAG: TolC family protein [Ignavibacteria bacterium]|nr:TolC family protein [Ignavibacteria bacterium]MBK7445109.1 TolC family protein [Ignavibacteria bacterium]MBL0107941.1 TolC family protein [Ignavibacteria bacterium]